MEVTGTGEVERDQTDIGSGGEKESPDFYLRLIDLIRNKVGPCFVFSKDFSRFGSM